MSATFTTDHLFSHTPLVFESPLTPHLAAPGTASEGTGGLCLSIDLRVYGEDALLRAAHRFTDRCYVHLRQLDGYTIEARFQSKPSSAVALDQIAGEFTNELLDQRLRARVQQESEPVRNLILAHALSRTSLIDSDLETSVPPPRQRAPGSADALPVTGIR